MTVNLALNVTPKLSLKNIPKLVSRDLRLRRFKIMDISKRDWKLFRERLSGWFIRK